MSINYFDLYNLFDYCFDKSVCFNLIGQDHRFSLVSSTYGYGIATSFANDISFDINNSLKTYDFSYVKKMLFDKNIKNVSIAIASINSINNNTYNLEKLNSFYPFEKYYLDDLDFHDKNVSIIGHMSGAIKYASSAKNLWVMEQNPQFGDYPETASYKFLPQSDYVIISGSTILNKTLPNLLELAKNSYVVLTGPTVPLIPELCKFGINRLAGLVITDFKDISNNILFEHTGNPYRYGKPFVYNGA